MKKQSFKTQRSHPPMSRPNGAKRVTSWLSPEASLALALALLMNLPASRVSFNQLVFGRTTAAILLIGQEATPMNVLKTFAMTVRHRGMRDRGRRARHAVVLALVGLFGASTLATGPIRPASARADASSWSYTGSLNTPRSYHTATLLSDGKILVAGGGSFLGNAFHPLDSAELYDPVTGTWSITGRLKVPRNFHTATLLRDGRLLLVAGAFGANSAELYDPKKGKWSRTQSLQGARYGHTATLLGNGKLLVAGGYDELTDPINTAELYDPDTGTWSLTGNLNTDSDGPPTATLLQNGKVLILRRGESPELYDPDAGKWSIISSPSRNIGFGHTATLLLDGRILLAGGEYLGPINSAELYDPNTGTWSSTGPLNTARSYHTATLLPNGKVLVAGGVVYRSSSGVTFGVQLANSELYDPDTGTWSFTSKLNDPRSGHTATLLPDGKVLIVGGLPNGLNTVELGYNFPAVAPPTIIMASVSGKKLIIAGENFEDGAVIVLNGKEQKTANDEQNPKTTLIGKKAGKKIRPGDTLQVRNPNGTLSQEFTFTG